MMETTSANPETSTAKTACGGSLHNLSEYPSATFKGECIYFCNDACLKAFLQAPDAFMAGEIEHPLEDAVASDR